MSGDKIYNLDVQYCTSTAMYMGKAMTEDEICNLTEPDLSREIDIVCYKHMRGQRIRESGSRYSEKWRLAMELVLRYQLTMTYHRRHGSVGWVVNCWWCRTEFFAPEAEGREAVRLAICRMALFVAMAEKHALWREGDV